jgi:hypothetical protein
MYGDEKGRAIELYSMRYSPRVSFTPSSWNQSLSPTSSRSSPPSLVQGHKKLLASKLPREVTFLKIEIRII